MVRTLTDAIATSLRCGSHSLHRHAFINEDACDEQFASLGLSVVFGFPVSNSRAKEFLHISSGSLLRETKYSQRSVDLHAADHVYDIARVARWRGAAFQL